MSTILVANPKGGSGKSTLSTNLAGFFAHRKQSVILSDLDRQKSALQWLQRRAEYLPAIQSSNGRKSLDHGKQVDWTVIDSPAGLHGEKLAAAIKMADWVVVPIQPSVFDRGAALDFIDALKEEKAIRKGRTFVAMVGMRIDGRTKSATQLREFLEEAEFPVITYLRDTQTYVKAAELGMTIFDMRPSFVHQDLVQWAPLTHWILSAEK